MTVKKTIKMLDWWINQMECKIQELANCKFHDSEIWTILFDNETAILNNLKKIKSELIPKCSHPKNMQDTCGGVVYCMDCNLDL